MSDRLFDRFFDRFFDDAAVFPPGNLPLAEAVVAHGRHRSASYAVDRDLAGRDVAVYVEVPRDERRPDVVAALAGTRYQAKLRTGGIRADLYPDERELAAAVLALTAASVRFKATAGLHHALRNTDPETGFEQHGFLNLMAAAAAARTGAGLDDLEALLAERDGARVVDVVRRTGSQVRAAFGSVGTCSIAEPTAELAALGLLDTPTSEDL